MIDLRQHPRLHLPKGVYLAWQSTQEKLLSYVGDLCLGGLFIRTRNPPSPGTSIQLLMDTPSGEIRARALVRNARPKIGMGVKFISMLPEHRARLGRWLNTLSA
jgi:hypothetical protein